MNQSITVDAILALTEQLSIVDKVRLIERVAQQITRELDSPKPKPRKSLRGLWRGIHINTVEINEARREVWSRFPCEEKGFSLRTKLNSL
ncbi:hypothetical protein KFU94_03825 [Chloroflexi bacterium TSY]|nr:hypothetical protein [Chloroflexi bacterium TSY]